MQPSPAPTGRPGAGVGPGPDSPGPGDDVREVMHPNKGGARAGDKLFSDSSRRGAVRDAMKVGGRVNHFCRNDVRPLSIQIVIVCKLEYSSLNSFLT